MVTLADFSDTASLMTCKRCGQLLEERDRFCRFCGQDQLDSDPDAPAVMPALIDITQAPANGGPAAPADGRWRLRKPRPIPGIDDPPMQRGPGGGVFPGRWAVLIAAVVLVVLAIALLHDLYRSRQDESTRRAELGTALAQVEEALGRGDLTEVQLKLDILDALNPNDADIKAKREAFERRVQELTAERDRLRETVAKEQGGATPVGAAAPALSSSSTSGESAAPSTPSAPTPSTASTASVAPSAAPESAAAPTAPATSSPTSAPSVTAAVKEAAPATAAAIAPAATTPTTSSPTPTPAPAAASVAAAPSPQAPAPTPSKPSPPAPSQAKEGPQPTQTSAPPPAAAQPTSTPTATAPACPEALAAMNLCPNR